MDELIKHQNVINYVKAQRLSRSEHINTRRMSKSGTVKKIHKWKPFTRRLVGRPKSRQDYYDLLRRAKWKSQEATRWDERVGNYLSVFMKEPPTRDRANLTPPKDGQRNVGPQAANR